MIKLSVQFILIFFVSSIFASSISIKNDDGKIFEVISLRNPEDIKNFPKQIGFDYRISFEDTKNSLSPYNGVDFDKSHTRSEIFIIYYEKEIVGVATLFVVPYKNLWSKGFLKKGVVLI